MRAGDTMKKIGLICILFITAFCLGMFLKVSSDYRVDVNDFDQVHLIYHYLDKQIDCAITDEQDIQALKSILNGIGAVDHPACGFSTDVAITFTKENQKITLCPATDGCRIVQVNDTNRYFKITDEERAQFDRIVEKYGMTFPCV